MKKNGFLTFCFAFIPGAGQMYQGYMKRGLSLVGICCLAIAVASLLSPLQNAALAVCCVVWMYSFFDTFNLRAQLGAGMAPADDYLVHLGYDVSLDRLLHRRHKLFGWVLVVLGVYTLYDGLLMDLEHRQQLDHPGDLQRDGQSAYRGGLPGCDPAGPVAGAGSPAEAGPAPL